MHGASMTNDFMISVSKQLGAIEQKADAAHKRLDDMQGEFKDTLKELSREVKELNANMNQQKGAKAMLIIIGSVVGSAITFLMKLIFK